MQHLLAHLPWRSATRTVWSNISNWNLKKIQYSSWSQVTALDRIELKEMTFFGFHGVYPHERSAGQRFILDVTIFCSLAKPGKSDDIKDTVPYENVFGQVKEIVEGKPSNLIEHVAEEIAKKILEHHLHAEGVEVSIRKPHCAIPGMVASSVGTITRRLRNKLDCAS